MIIWGGCNGCNSHIVLEAVEPERIDRSAPTELDSKQPIYLVRCLDEEGGVASQNPDRG
jgi:hypothetical protein